VRGRLSLERTQLGLLAALAATAPVSIFASEIMLALSVAVLAARLASKRTRLAETSLDTPLLAFSAWSLLAASFASDPAASHQDAKKLVLFAVFYLAVEVLTPRAARERLLGALLLGGLALASLMVVQHHFLGFDRLARRPHGFLGHYMTAAGVTLCVMLLAAARIGTGPRGRLRDAWPLALVLAGVAGVAFLDAHGHPLLGTRLFVAGLALLAAILASAPGPRAVAAQALLPALVLPIALWALVVSQTRGAWIGALAGLATVAVARAPRLLWLVGAGVLALLVARPSSLANRLTLTDASSVDRYYMWQAGIDMVLERPVFGMGPGMILTSYPRYRWPEAPNRDAPHLHNNMLQIAAERGLPGLAFFVWWTAAIAIATLREVRRARANPDPDPLLTGALGVLAGILVAGLFEYNLGDSEVLIIVLLLTAVPFALARERTAVAV
jgi:O-antigen ligase